MLLRIVFFWLNIYCFNDKKALKMALSSKVRYTKRHYSPGWALASSTICVYIVLSFEMVNAPVTSLHLVFGLPCIIVLYTFTFSTFFCIWESAIFKTCPYHCILHALMNLTLSWFSRMSFFFSLLPDPPFIVDAQSTVYFSDDPSFKSFQSVLVSIK